MKQDGQVELFGQREVRFERGVVRRHAGELRRDLSQAREAPGGIRRSELRRVRLPRLQDEWRGNETPRRGIHPLLHNRGVHAAEERLDDVVAVHHLQRLRERLGMSRRRRIRALAGLGAADGRHPRGHVVRREIRVKVHVDDGRPFLRPKRLGRDRDAAHDDR